MPLPASMRMVGSPAARLSFRHWTSALIYVSCGCRVCRLGQHQHCQFLAAGFRHPSGPKKVEVLRHDGLQRLVVIGAGGPVLGTAEILDGHRRHPPSPHSSRQSFVTALKARSSTPESRASPSAQLRPEIGDLVFLDAVLLRGVVDADQYPELPVRRLLQQLGTWRR